VKISSLVLVRHAESTRNAAKAGTFFVSDEQRRTVRGIADVDTPLTEVGWQQAEQTGLALRSNFPSFDVIFHSGYQRTIQTTEGLLRSFPPEERSIPQRSDVLLRERDTGYAFDMTQQEAAHAFTWLAEYWKTFGAFFAHPPGGESMAQVCQRVGLFLDRLQRDFAGKKILVVSHGGTIRAFRYWLESWTYEQAAERFQHHSGPKNCSITSYTNQDDELILQDDYKIFY
jgi:broad specificity phosphatase PhoE